MKFLNIRLLFCSFFILDSLSYHVLSDEVPVVLWNIEGKSLNIRPVSAVSRDDNVFSEAVQDVLKNKANILIYSTSALSLEDFTPADENIDSNRTVQKFQTYLDTQKYMFLSSVKNPMKTIHESHCGVQEIVVDQDIDSNVLQSIYLAFERSCIVILHVPTSGLGSKDSSVESIERLFNPPLTKRTKDIVGVFTGLKSSWQGALSEEPFKSRNLLAAEEADANNFVNINDCLIMYADAASIKTGDKTVKLTLPPSDTKGSECGESSAILSLGLKGDDGSTYTVKFNFTAAQAAWKTTTKVTISGAEEDFSTKDLEAPVGYSFSCGQYRFKSKKMASGSSIEFTRFQVQPFKVSNKKFSESFDCVTWFTIPIWMGLIVSLLFVAIIHCGVYSIFSISTMDRFDDPKGKTITVAVSE